MTIKRLLTTLLVAAWLGVVILSASAQGPVKLCFPTASDPSSCITVNSVHPLPVDASVSASITGFAPASTGTPISVTTGGVTGTLPAGAVVVASNVGATNGAFCKLGGTATTSDQLISPHSWFAFTVGAATQLTCITSTSTTTVNMIGGTGLPTGAGGGGGSGSSGSVTQGTSPWVVGQGTAANLNATVVGTGTFATQSAATIADGADAALGALADAAATQGSTGSVSAKLRTMTAQLNTIAASIAAAIPAGTNTIGTVGQLPYPVGATPITASATGTTGATTATLASVGGKTTYICGYSIRANATAATTVTNTITGVITATLSSIMWVAPLASGIGIDEQIFSPCVPASGTNVDIAIVSGAPGSGGTVSSKGWGYNL